MPPFPHRPAPLAALLPGLLAVVVCPVPAQAHELVLPHMIHEYEGWMALAVVVLSLVGAAVLVRRALRR